MRIPARTVYVACVFAGQRLPIGSKLIVWKWRARTAAPSIDSNVRSNRLAAWPSTTEYRLSILRLLLVVASLCLVTSGRLVAQALPNGATYPGSSPAPTFASVIVNPVGSGTSAPCAVGTSGCTGLPQIPAGTAQIIYSPNVTDVTTVTGGYNFKSTAGNLYSCTLAMDGSQSATDQWFLADFATVPVTGYNVTPTGHSGADNGTMINQGWVGTTAKVTISIGVGLMSPTPFQHGINVLISSTTAPMYTADSHAQVSCTWE